MIPALILYLLKRFRKSNNTNKIKVNLKKVALKIKSVFLLPAILCTLAFSNVNEDKSLTYNVLKNDSVIGTIIINKEGYGDSIVYNLKSNIQAKFLFKFKVKGREKAVFKKGVLVYSSVYRTLNNKTKVNHEIVFKEGKYNVNINNLIKRNLITLYYNEPTNVKTVFCDNLKKMVKVQPIGNGRYRVDFENGKYNIFHYKSGKCIKVEAVSRLFNVIIIPA
ncbi:hypothetical protein GSB9_02824 [Flavobacteriaceae bacterium GSB9]|nr:hypothetical protein GSB9_02824 [Flavobacteriaceae bacterium GSB9]